MKIEDVKIGSTYYFKHMLNPDDPYNNTIVYVEECRGNTFRVSTYNGIQGTVYPSELFTSYPNEVASVSVSPHFKGPKATDRLNVIRWLAEDLQTKALSPKEIIEHTNAIMEHQSKISQAIHETDPNLRTEHTL